MKQIESNYVNEYINGVSLFRDDLEELLHHFQDRSLPSEISDSNNLYESLDEVLKHKGYKPSNLSFSGSIKGSFSALSVTFNRGEARLYANGSSELRSFAYELKDFLVRKIPWHYKVFNPWIWGVLALIDLMLYWNLPSKSSLESTIPSLVGWSVISLLFVWITCLTHHRVSFGIRLTRRHETGFFRRNSDQVMLVFIGSIVGTLVTLFVQWLIGR